MNHWIILPVVLPALLAPILAFVMRHDIPLARATSLAGTVLVAGVALGLVVIAGDGAVHVYRLGNWPAPFGIVLVLDRLSAMLVLLTAVLALIALMHAIATDWDRRGAHFHALFQFQIMGITGAFLTGDVFNLFVFFEILLIASYGLMIHGGGRMRVKAGLQYVVMNLAGSTLFLFALGTIYATTGTLNIADLALVVREIPVEDAALVRVAAMLLLIVFAIKAALFPVQFWLPATYANAPGPVAALFAIMTKVGAYSIIRVYTVVFGPDVAATGTLPGDWLMPAALVTVAIGGIGVMGARGVAPLVAFSVIGSTGAMMAAVAAFTPAAMTAALYYLLHSTFAAAALFLLADLVLARRGDGALRAMPATAGNGILAALFLAAAVAMAGLPPLSGFLGKLLILDTLRDAPAVAGGWPLAWAVVLGGSLLTILGLVRAGSILFWKSTAAEFAPDPAAPPQEAPGALALAPVMFAAAIPAVLAIAAGPVAGYLDGVSAQLFDPDPYVAAVLGPPGDAEAAQAEMQVLPAEEG